MAFHSLRGSPSCVGNKFPVLWYMVTSDCPFNLLRIVVRSHVVLKQGFNKLLYYNSTSHDSQRSRTKKSALCLIFNW